MGVNRGLWYICTDGSTAGGCIKLGDDNNDLNVWRAFAIMACLLAGFGSWFRIHGAITESKAVSTFGYLFFFAGCKLFLLFNDTVFTIFCVCKLSRCLYAHFDSGFCS